MEIQGTWTKDEEGYMTFNSSQLQQYFEQITNQYHRVYNRYANEYDDEIAFLKAREDGYTMVTDYKIIEGNEEFATSFTTPAFKLDMWYETDPYSGKRDYNRGFIRVIAS